MEQSFKKGIYDWEERSVSTERSLDYNLLSSIPLGPTLVGIEVGTGPGLDNVAVGSTSVGKVEAKT